MAASTLNASATSATAYSSQASGFTQTFGGAVQSGSLLVALLRCGTAARSIASITDDQGTNTWAKATRKQGSNPSNTYCEIWWAASTTAATPTITVNTTGATTLTGVVTLIEIRPAVASTWTNTDTDGTEDTSGATTHTGAAALDGVDGDAMLAVSRAATSDGGAVSGLVNWTALEETGVNGQTIYRLPSGTVTGDTVPWSSVSSVAQTTASATFHPTASATGGFGMLLSEQFSRLAQGNV